MEGRRFLAQAGLSSNQLAHQVYQRIQFVGADANALRLKRSLLPLYDLLLLAGLA